ncbi:MAG: hypothetical protein KME45_03030 [Stenomitos rutilans HA7619-LM2]|jgi:hypothetical protein|nr:hypothetical protein [Stenomitos rutilans HA7619-LM2]MBW4469358.1 hypothetical protein [Stenomitos rutilans HA7619-LM2]
MIQKRSKHPLYDTWSGMIQRCTNPAHPSYKHYGGRGIKVCPQWRKSFAVFLQDMGGKPSPQHTLERKNNDGNYEPGNVIWGTWAEQARNRRNNRLLTLRGESKTIAEWVELRGIPRDVIKTRLKAGWAEEKVLTVPVCVQVRKSRPPSLVKHPFGLVF